jgi:hypothetical protein
MPLQISDCLRNAVASEILRSRAHLAMDRRQLASYYVRRWLRHDSNYEIIAVLRQIDESDRS